MGKRLSIEEVQARADLIWKAYHKNGSVITRAEIAVLIGTSYSSVYKIFKRRSVYVPEPSDTILGKQAKKATKLNATGKKMLTTREVSDILGLGGANEARNHYPQIAEHFDIPEMVGAAHSDDAKMPDRARDTFYERHSEGLQVMSRRDLGNGKAIYQLR